MKERFSPDCRTLAESDGTGGVAPARHWLSPSELGKGRKSVGHSVLSKGGEYGTPRFILVKLILMIFYSHIFWMIQFLSIFIVLYGLITNYVQEAVPN